jgi:hypothetical protein
MQNNHMAYCRSLMAAVALLAGGCAPGVSGIVRDAANERPVGGALVEVRDSGWGFRRNQFVWDAEKVSRAMTDGVGRFRLGADGGHGLRVIAPGRPNVDTRLCSRSPMIVRVGGPYANIRPGHRLVFRHEGPANAGAGSAPSYLAKVEDVAIRASGGAFDDEEHLRLETDGGGVRFVAGTGAIPSPPPVPYDQSAELDVRSDCGWLFVSNETSPVAVIQVASFGWQQKPGRPRQWVMLYSPLSDQ